MHKKRGYQRDVPAELVRDYKLFAIACEGGKREPQYFNLFRFLSPRVTVDVIEDVVSDDEMLAIHQHKSAPRWVLDRAVRYVDKEGLSSEDELWFVLDRDRWTNEQIREIQSYCEQHQNWHLAVSNPCFEVWLMYHIKSDLKSGQSNTCNDFKQELNSLTQGGYHPLKFISSIKDAISNGTAADTNPRHFLPEVKETKIYQLADSIMSFVGENDFDEFVNVILPKMIAVKEAKIKVTRKKK